MNNLIKIIATKRTCKGWKEDEYDLKIEAPFREELKVPGLFIGTYEKIEVSLMKRKDKAYLKTIKKPYGNNKEVAIECYVDKGYFIVSDKEHYSKHELLSKIEKFRKFIPISIEFDENAWTDSKAWNIDISKQITVKVLKPIGMQIMGSTIVKGEVFTTIENKKPNYPVDYGYVEYPKGNACKTVVDLVHVLFRKLDVLGAEVKIDGGILSYNEANQTKPRNIKLIEIFL